MTTIPAAFLDLLRQPGTAVLTTNGADGYPQSTAVWFRFDAESGTIRIVMQARTRKAANLARDRRCTFLLIDPEDAHHVIEIRADAVLTRESGVFPLANTVMAAYGTSIERIDPGPDRDDRIVATLTPIHVTTVG